MVIIQPDGSFILESGDPNFESVIPDIFTPVNDLIDPIAEVPVSQLVLDTFGIPFIGAALGGTLPGQDIKNQDPATILKLSLATELLDPLSGGSSGFAEVEIAPDGFARFYVVGAQVAANLDFRYCIPTSQITIPADLVIVRGYDPPPSRELRTTFNGLKNAEVMDYKDCAAGSCEERAVGKFATVSYDDPLLDQVYLDDILNSYELEAFETLMGYIVDLDMPDGVDPDSPNFRAGLKITFGDTTREYITVTARLLNNFVQITGDDPLGRLLGVTGLSGGGSISGPISATAGSSTTIPVLVTTVDETLGECTTNQLSIVGSKVAIPVSRFQRLNKFGNLESDFIGVEEIVFVGRKVVRLVQLGGAAGATGLFDVLVVEVRPLKELITLQHGKNWVWDVDADGNVEVQLFSIVEDEFGADVCATYTGQVGFQGLDAAENQILRTTDQAPLLIGGGADDTPGTGVAEEVNTDFLNRMICNIGDRLGYEAVDGNLCIVVDRKRPSIDIFDPQNGAGQLAEDFVNGIFGVRYTPIVIVDPPAPIAYAATGPLSNADLSKTIAAEGLIDQADGIVDADPTTTQALEDSELSILQDNTNGATIDVTLPFCTDQECVEIAKNFLAEQSQEIITQSIVLGPTSEPNLGDVMPDGSGSIINEISYSYSDSSQYLITISTGPKYLTGGSFNDMKYQLRTEDVTREGVIVQDVGNGAEYVVRVEGFGEITALSFIVDDMSVGDKVNVRIYNNPVERI